MLSRLRNNPQVQRAQARRATIAAGNQQRRALNRAIATRARVAARSASGS